MIRAATLVSALLAAVTGPGGILLKAGAGSPMDRSGYHTRANLPQLPSVDDSLLPEICGCSVETGVSYGPGPGQSNLMNIYRPTACEQELEGPFPVIVYIHGGAWVGGHRDAYGEVCDEVHGCGGLGPFYAKRGIAGFSIDYTLTTPEYSSWPVAIQDVILAIRHIRENAGKYNIDPERIAVLGHSAGGHLASLVGTLSRDETFLSGISGSRVSLVMDHCGPTDFEFVGEQGLNYKPYGAIQGFLGGTYTDNWDRWLEASPAAHVTSDDPVFVIAHGTADDTVSFPISESFADRLIQAGVETHFVRIDGGGHGFTEEEDLSVRHVLEPLLRRVFDLRPPDPTAELGQLEIYIGSLPAAFFRAKGSSGDKIREALCRKIAEVMNMVEAGLYEEALKKLFNDIRAKLDGGSPAQDWVGDQTVRSRLCGLVDHIIEGILSLQEDR